jgi:TrmH family RNA methyltransferase
LIDLSPPLRPLKWYRELAGTRAWREAGAFLVEGDRAVRQVMALHAGDIIEVLTTSEPPAAAYRSFPSRRLTESQVRYISGHRTPQGVLAVVRAPAGIYSPRLPSPTGSRVLLLEDVQDPGNVGSLVRTAAAFDFSGVILTDKCADPLSPKCVQATAGSVLSVWLRRTDRYLEMARALREDGYRLVAAELGGPEDTSVLARENLVLALGNEGAGLSRELLEMADFRLRLPVAGARAESINVAACGAILMYLSSR